MTRALLLAALFAPLALAPALAAPEKPEAPGRNGAKPDAAKPDASKSDAAKSDAAKPGAAKPAETKPAEAKPARGGVALPGGESREPITIDADSLEWFDKEQKAIYTGNVVAKQGEATLKSSQLRIFMLKAAKGAEPAGPAPSGPGVGGDNQIERMEADGPVELIQKDQTATGDSGVYERGLNAVTLIGHVALRQAGHVTYGDRLVYDLDTRQAVVQNPRGTFAPRAAPAAPPKR
jgi:lipopolysaccharide export system protein LptA